LPDTFTATFWGMRGDTRQSAVSMILQLVT
jgi:hypothetical protein